MFLCLQHLHLHPKPLFSGIFFWNLIAHLVGYMYMYPNPFYLTKNFWVRLPWKSHIQVEILTFFFGVQIGPKVQIQTLILGCRCFLTNLQISDTNTKIIDSLKSGSGSGLVVTKLGAYLLLLAFGVNRNSFRCRVDCVLTCWCGVTLLVCDIGP